MTTEQKAAAIKRIFEEHQKNVSAVAASEVPEVYVDLLAEALTEVTRKRLVEVFEKTESQLVL